MTEANNLRTASGRNLLASLRVLGSLATNKWSMSRGFRTVPIVSRGRRIDQTVALALVLSVASACSSSDRSTAGDCDAKLRIDQAVYVAYSVTDTRPSAQFQMADEATCEDVGENSRGAVFGVNPPQLQTWSFSSYDPDEVLGARLGDSWRVFFNESLSEGKRASIAADLGS